jgi:S1-C subfamily serine protease
MRGRNAVFQGRQIQRLDITWISRQGNPLAQSRGEGGVLVIATLGETLALGETLDAGDIIYRMNRHPVTSSVRLRRLLSEMKAGEPVAFQVERDGRLHFVATEIP